MRVTPLGWLYLVLLTVVLPWIAFRSTRRLRKSGLQPTRAQHLASVAVSQGWLLMLAVVVSGDSFVRLFPPVHLGPVNMAIVDAFLIVTLGTLPARWRWKPAEERARLRWMYPQKASDLAWWAIVSLTAGVVEEIAYRGVMFTLWKRATGSWWGATALCVVPFALVHIIQGWRAVLFVVLFTTAFHLIVGYTGDLYTVMVAHVVYDFLAGVIILNLYRREPAGAGA